MIKKSTQHLPQNEQQLIESIHQGQYDFIESSSTFTIKQRNSNNSIQIIITDDELGAQMLRFVFETHQSLKDQSADKLSVLQLSMLYQTDKIITQLFK